MFSGTKREPHHHRDKRGARKRARHRFNVEGFLEKILDDYFESEDDDVIEFINNVERIANLIADAAVVNDYAVDEKIKKIILKFATSHLKHYRIFLPDPYDKTRSSATLEQVLIHQLKHRVHASNSRMRHLITYLSKYKEHNPLAGIFAECKTNSTSNVNELIINLLTQVKDFYEKDGSIPPEWFADYLAIEHFLSNEPLVESYLDELEKLLQQYAASHVFPELQTREDGRLMLPGQPPETCKRYKILSNVICDWSKANGFTAQAKIINLLSQKGFLGLLSSATLIKDKAVDAGEYHGAWTHAIQWFCIMEHQKRTGFLRHDPLLLYRNAGPLWNKIFDLLGEVNYTCAPKMTHRMYEPDALDRWPLLAGSITRIYHKMHLSGMNYPEHLREKCGNKAFAQGYQKRSLQFS